MANTHNPNPLMLDREDKETLGQSTRRQWSLIGHLLHLPPIETLANENQRIVANRIAVFMQSIRGGIANRAELATQLHVTYQARLEDLPQIGRGTNPIGAITNHLGVTTAEAWLQTIYANFGEEELRNMIRALPASIIPTTGDGFWRGPALNLGTPPVSYVISIDLTNPIWKTGNQEAISRRLVGRTFAQAGITTNPVPPLPQPILQQPDVDNIFESICDVVDPRLSVGQVQLDNQPVPGERLIIDMASIIRNNPNIANMNAGAMITAFQAGGISSRDFRRYYSHIDMHTGAPLSPIANVQIGTIVPFIFDRLSRNRTQSFGARQSTLAEAILYRQPLDSLISGDASNRELLLALSMIQRDPAAAAVLEEVHGETGGLVARRGVADTLKQFESIQPIVMPAQISADSTFQDCVDDITGIGVATALLDPEESAWIAAEQAYQRAKAVDEFENKQWETDREEHNKMDARYQAAETNFQTQLTNHATALAKVPVGATPPTAPTRHTLTPPGALRPRPPITATGLTPTFTPTSIVRPISATIRSIEELRTRMTELRTLLRELQIANSKFQERADLLTQVRAAMNGAHITPADITRLFPNFDTLVPAAGVNRNQLRANTNWAPIIQEIKNNFPSGLLAVEEYDTQITAARSHSSDSGPVGSDACRAVVERGLTHEGLRDKELDDTVQYMFNSIQKNNESETDLRMYADRAFPDGEDNHHAEEHWEEHKAYRSFRPHLSIVPFQKTHPYHEYLGNLAAPGNLGFDLREGAPAPNFGQRTIPDLIDVHFRLKYLTELPDSDKLHLPSTEHIVAFQRNLYRHIVDRMQKSFNRANGFTSTEFNQLRAKGLQLEADKLPTMSAQERMQRVRGFLHDTAPYMSDPTNKANFDRMTYRAMHPIEEAKKDHEKYKSWVNPIGSLNWSPMTWPKAIIYSGPKFVLKKSWNKAIIPAGKVIKNNKSETAGIAAGFFIGGPIGSLLALGAVKIFKKVAGVGAAPAAADHSHGH